MWLALGILLLVAWLVLWLVFQVAEGAVHLLVFAAALFVLYQGVRWLQRRRAHGSA